MVDHFKKILVFTAEASKQLHKIYTNRYQEIYKVEWTDSAIDKYFYKHDDGKYIRSLITNKGKRFQTNLDTGETSKWDITMMSTILNAKPFYTEMYATPIKELSNWRNNIYHTADLTQISDTYYYTILDTFISLMKKLNYSDQDFLRLHEKINKIEPGTTIIDRVKQLEFKEFNSSKNDPGNAIIDLAKHTYFQPDEKLYGNNYPRQVSVTALHVSGNKYPRPILITKALLNFNVNTQSANN